MKANGKSRIGLVRERRMAEAKHRVSEESLMAGWRQHIRRRGIRFDRIHLLFAPVFFLCGLLFLLFGDEQDLRAVVIPCAASGTVFLVGPLVAGWRIRRTVRKSPDLDTKVTWVFSEQGISMKGTAAEVARDWDRIYDAVIHSDGLLLYLEKDQFMWLPRSAFGSESEFEESGALIEEHCPKKTRA
jgi:hypothetical protein